MPYVPFALSTVSVVVLFNLLLTFGIIRRLRQQASLLNAHQPNGVEASIAHEPGTLVGDFVGHTLNDDVFEREALTDYDLVAFFSTTCSACLDQLPAFIEHATVDPAGSRRALAVVVGSEDVAGMAGKLERAGTVLVEQPNGNVSTAFGIRGFPAFVQVDADGVILEATWSVSALPARIAR